MEMLISVLRSSTSQNQQEFQPATAKLQELQSTDGYYLQLLQISLMFDSLDTNIRLAAVIQLKYGVERKWRSYCSNHIHNDEKNAIKENILKSLEERSMVVARQFAYVISRIARYDYPHEWQDLFRILLSRMYSANLQNPTYTDCVIFLTFRMVVTELVSKQLMSERSKISETCHLCHPALMEVWEKTHKLVIDIFQGNSSSFHLLDIHLNIVKSLRRMARRLDSSSLRQLLILEVSALQSICEAGAEMKKIGEDLNKYYNKILLNHSKVIMEVLDSKGSPLGGAVVNVLNFCKRCVLVCSKNRSLLPKRFVLSCMNHIKQIVQDNETSIEVVWCEDELKDLVRCLVFDYFPLTTEDLELWQDDVTEFCVEGIGENWKYSLKPSAEALFITLLRGKTNLLSPIILSTLNFLEENQHKDSTIEDCLIECAVYESLGLSATELFDLFDFEEYFIQTLIPRLQKAENKPFYKIIHRSIIKLLRSWIDIKPFTKVLETTWQFVISSLDRNLDFAVRIAACEVVTLLLEDYENETKLFYPHQNVCVQSLYHLLLESNEDLKLTVLDVFTCVIQRVGRKATFVEALVNILRDIWIQCDNHMFLKLSILSTMTSSVVALHQRSNQLHSIALPMIHSSCNVSSNNQIYMGFDGLQLLLAVVQNATVLSDQLLEIFICIFPVMEQGIDEMKEGFSISKSYLLLGKDQFTNHPYFQSLGELINRNINEFSLELIQSVVDLIESCLQISPAKSIQVFWKSLVFLFNSAETGDILTHVATSIHILACWVTILDKNAGLGYLQHIFKETDEYLAGYKFVELMSSKLDSIVEAEQKKIVISSMVLVINSIINQEILFSKGLIQMIYSCVPVLFDVCDDEGVDVIRISNQSDSDPTDVDCHETRSRNLLKSRITFNFSLVNFLQEHLNNWNTKFSSDLNKFISENVDSEITKDLHYFLSKVEIQNS